MDEPLVHELMQRIQALESDKRRWKLLGLSALGALGMVVLLGALGAAAVLTMHWQGSVRGWDAERQARMEAEQARMEAERARAEAQQQLQLLELQKQQAIREERDRAKKFEPKAEDPLPGKEEK